VANQTRRNVSSARREARRGLLREVRRKEPIPDKLYFRIGEVARLTGVQPYILRYWESEFPLLQPKKSGTGQRLYRKRDIEIIFKVKELLYRDGANGSPRAGSTNPGGTGGPWNAFGSIITPLQVGA